MHRIVSIFVQTTALGTRKLEQKEREEREEREGRLLDHDSAAGRLSLRSTKREEVTGVISRVERSRESN